MLTSKRWVSALSLVVVSSAAILQKGFCGDDLESQTVDSVEDD